MNNISEISLNIPFDWSAHVGLLDYAEQLSALAEAFRYWNSRINLVSRQEIDLLEQRHILPCAVIARVADFSGLKTYLDIGTGGGLPGLVIAILYPHLECTLLDSTAKKLTAVADMASRIGLKNVQTVHARIEDMNTRYDVVTGRAVTALPRFLGWARGALKDAPQPAGLYYWKGGDFEPEIERWGLLPDETYPLDGLLNDVYFKDKYIARYEAKRLLKNRHLNAVQ